MLWHRQIDTIQAFNLGQARAFGSACDSVLLGDGGKSIHTRWTVVAIIPLIRVLIEYMTCTLNIYRHGHVLLT